LPYVTPDRTQDEAAVVRSIVLDARRDDVWEAVTTPGGLSAWLGEVVELELRPGGRLGLRDPAGAALRGSVEAVDTGRSFVVRWRRLDPTVGAQPVGAAARVTFRLDDEDDGTRLTVREEPVSLATRSA
jgi:uncharacterized protein YndB with AHSA1/START domain